MGLAWTATEAADGPAVATTQSPTESTESAEPGTLIIGEQESAVGLFLMPWKDEAPAPLTMPPGQLGYALSPVDEASFARHSDYYESATAYRLAKRERKR